jgi:hypothetical protein
MICDQTRRSAPANASESSSGARGYEAKARWLFILGSPHSLRPFAVR